MVEGVDGKQRAVLDFILTMNVTVATGFRSLSVVDVYIL